MIKKWLIFNLIFLLILPFLVARPTWAAGSLYFSPKGGSYGIGDTLTVSVRVSTGGEAINAISAYVSYPSDALDFSWVGEGGSIFSIWAEKYGGGGIVKMSGGRLPPPFSGDGLVGTIAFKVKKTGTATLSFAGGSHIVTASTNSDIYGGGGTATFTLTPAVPKPSATSSTIASPSALPSQISNIKFTTATNSAVIYWETKNPSDSTVEYGLEHGKYIMVTTKKEKVLEHLIKLAGLAPETTFYFVMKSADERGNLALSKEWEFMTQSPVEVGVLRLEQKWVLITAGILLLLVLVLVVSYNWLRRKGGDRS